ncbi:MAG TPA: hypothetical protein VNF29_14215, partial [Candidatus Binataceae bacterium]|nr:hypothetical protein [Candidatus Binataceae bacterium]
MKGEVSNLHEIKNDSYGRRGAIDQDEVHVAARKAEASRLADFIKALPFDRKSGDRGSVSFMAREENTTAASRK